MCREPFRALENALIWSDPTKLTYFSCLSFCPFLVIAGMYLGHMCLIGKEHSSKFMLLVCSELRSEAAWIWSLLSEPMEGSKLWLFSSDPKGPSTLGRVPAQISLLPFLPCSQAPSRLTEGGILGKLVAGSEGVRPTPPDPTLPSGKVSISKQPAAFPSREC